MKIRRRSLPPGWYPSTEAETAAALDGYLAGVGRGRASACVAPHAGWYFSGRLAARALAALDPGADVVVVMGGHLGPRSAPLAAFEDAFETPCGDIAAAAGLRDAIAAELGCAEDLDADNTVEVLLPMVRLLFPRAGLVWLRFPAAPSARTAGKTVAEAAAKAGVRAVAVGSTDLTHYGPNYGFSPAGSGKAAVQWVKGKNDARFLDALLAGDAEGALAKALAEGSACSPGAALGAFGFAEGAGADRAELLDHATSWDVRPDESFVGYASVAWTRSSSSTQ